MKYNRILILVISLVLFGLILTFTGCESKKSATKGSDIFYNFQNLDGKKVNFKDYKGKYSVLTFTFTSCPSICPMIHKELIKIRDNYKNQVNIISINVDPDNDSPESIKKYMKDNGFDWDVLIGDVENIEKVMNVMLDQPNRKLSSPALHLPNLYLMNKDFEYIDKFFPESVEVGNLIAKLDSFEL